jgi:DNA repair photolyase
VGFLQQCSNGYKKEGLTMIVSASRRTDIPAFFTDWFINRIREGFLLVRNPMNLHQVGRINLSPKVVDCIVFWSKNPVRMIERLSILKSYSFYFQFTVTGYGQRLEPNVPSRQEVINTFVNLSRQIGKDRVIWRYDPIILTDNFDIKYHIHNFENIASQLYRRTRRCVISFVDMYKKTMRNMTAFKIYEISGEQMIELSVALKNVCSKYDIELTSCAEIADLSSYGITHGKCIDDKLIEEISGFTLDVRKDTTQRAECGCVASVDIGAYNTCAHECLYCYANYNHALVHRNYAAHDPNSPLLFGTIAPNDKIYERKAISCRELQQTLFKNDKGAQG